MLRFCSLVEKTLSNSITLLEMEIKLVIIIYYPFCNYLLSYFKQNGNTTETIKIDHYTISKVPYIVIFKISHNVNNKQTTTQRINACL